MFWRKSKKVVFFAVFESKYGKQDISETVENPTEDGFLQWVEQKKEWMKIKNQSSGVACINAKIIKL